MTLDEAKIKARQHNMFIVTKPNCLLLYRGLSAKPVLIAKRRKEKAIISLVRKLTVDKAEKPS